MQLTFEQLATCNLVTCNLQLTFEQLATRNLQLGKDPMICLVNMLFGSRLEAKQRLATCNLVTCNLQLTFEQLATCNLQLAIEQLTLQQLLLEVFRKLAGLEPATRGDPLTRMPPDPTTHPKEIVNPGPRTPLPTHPMSNSTLSRATLSPSGIEENCMDSHVF